MSTRTSCDRAVSAAAAFTLTFALVVAVVGVVYVAGFDSLNQIRNVEATESGDRAMQGVAETFDEIHRDNVPGRTLEIGVNGGSINTYESSLAVTVNTSSRNTTYDVETNAFVLQRSEDRAELIYEGGALFRVSRPGTVLKHRPVATCSDGVALLSFVELEGSVSASPSGTVQLVGRSGETGTYFPNQYNRSSDAVNVTVNVTDTYYDRSWRAYFEQRPGWTGSGGEYRCEADQAFVRRSVIELEALF